jgi:hypothetical protein
MSAARAVRLIETGDPRASRSAAAEGAVAER